MRNRSGENSNEERTPNKSLIARLIGVFVSSFPSLSRTRRGRQKDNTGLTPTASSRLKIGRIGRMKYLFGIWKDFYFAERSFLLDASQRIRSRLHRLSK